MVLKRMRPVAIRVMVSPQEKAELQRAADRAAMPVSVFVRVMALVSARGDASPRKLRERTPERPPTKTPRG
jgi:hypothetical protein